MALLGIEWRPRAVACPLGSAVDEPGEAAPARCHLTGVEWLAAGPGSAAALDTGNIAVRERKLMYARHPVPVGRSKIQLTEF